ncbi:Transposable element Tcb1 transposase, partial [Stegodyphus mimosarum]
MHLDDLLRGRIIGRLECERTQLEVSDELGIAQSVISKLWQQFQDDGNVRRRYSIARPRVTTPNEDRYLAVTGKRNRRSTASDLSRQLSSAPGTTISRQTVYRRLGQIGLYARRPVRCVPLTSTHCRLRLAWSREHAQWTPQQWACVMFSDESRFSLQSDSHRTFIWRAPGTRYHQENIIERHRYGGAGVLVWGEIILGSRTDLHVQIGTMTSQIYRDVFLEQHKNTNQLIKKVLNENPSLLRNGDESHMPAHKLDILLHYKIRAKATHVPPVFGLAHQRLSDKVEEHWPRRMAFAADMLRRIEDDAEFPKRIMFSGEASFHLFGISNRHNVRICGFENPHECREAQRDSPKVNVWCGLMHDRVTGAFFFTEKTVSSVVYLDMLENFVFPQLEELQPHVFLQQDGAPPHWGTIVRSSLNGHFTGRWIGRGGPIPWLSRSPDITPLDFFLWGFVKGNVYRRRVSNMDDLKARITTTIASVDADVLASTWREIEYRLDILRATKEVHVEVH